MREKLIELLKDADELPFDTYDGAVDFLIANGVTIATDNNVGKWIPVTEKLPKEWEKVLAWSKFGFCEASVYLGISGKWRVTWNHALLEQDTVTHWMPLPEPPNGE